MFRHTFIRLTLAALSCFSCSCRGGSASEKDPGDPGDIRDALAPTDQGSFPKPLLPKILDDYPGPPNPNPYNTRTFEGSFAYGDILAVGMW